MRTLYLIVAAAGIVTLGAVACSQIAKADEPQRGLSIQTTGGPVVVMPEQTITARSPTLPRPPVCDVACQHAWLADAIRYLRANPGLKVCDYQEDGVLWVREKTGFPGGRCWPVRYMPSKKTGWK